MNRLRFVATAIILFFSTPIILHGQSKEQVRNVVGTYESCLMGCTVIKIRTDFTFSYQPMSDVGEPQIVQGTWKFEETNIIVANTFEQPNKYPFSIKLNADQKGLTVRILDKKGMPIQWAEVHIPNENGMLIAETNKDGLAEFPRCDPRGMTVKQPFSNYVNSSAVFEFPDKDFNYVEAKINFIPLFITDQRWLIQNGKLYFIDSYPISKIK
jgi:hypothetical protein